MPVGKRGPRRHRENNDASAGQDNFYSPGFVSQTSPSDRADTRDHVQPRENDVLGIWQDLLRRLCPHTRDRDIKSFFLDCVDGYMKHLFPITPVIHEASLRGLVAELCSNSEIHSTPIDTIQHSPRDGMSFTAKMNAIAASPHALALSNRFLPVERSLTLLLALCAQVCSLLPDYVFSTGDLARIELFSASKRMLRLYHDRDVEHPCATSIIIRYFHSSCSHAAGNTRVSWLVLGEAIRLALEMKVFDESSLLGVGLLERQLRRAIFWQLSTGDKSSSILNNRPLCFQSLNFDVAPSTQLIQETPLRDPLRSCNSAEFESGLGHGFALISSLFGAVTDVLIDLKFLRHTTTAQTSSTELVQGLRKVVREDLLRFQSALDNLPDWLDRPWQWRADLSTADLEYQRKSNQ